MNAIGYFLILLSPLILGVFVTYNTLKPAKPGSLRARSQATTIRPVELPFDSLIGRF